MNHFDRFSKKNHIQNLVRNRSLVAELFLAVEETADGHTDMTKLVVAFRNFLNTLRLSLVNFNNSYE